MARKSKVNKAKRKISKKYAIKSIIDKSKASIKGAKKRFG